MRSGSPSHHWPGGHDGGYWQAHYAAYVRFCARAQALRVTARSGHLPLPRWPRPAPRHTGLSAFEPRRVDER